MIRFRAVVNGHEISKRFDSWDETLRALEEKGLKVSSYSADPTPEVNRNRKDLIIKVHFKVVPK
jgi:hypothetical protein